jgi:O-antigen/teichoic acid export membrane protein
MGNKYKTDVLFNYLSQFITIGISFIFVPLFLNKLGSEAYGLVGFFSSLQMWFLILDFGLSQTLIRETSRFSNGDIAENEFYDFMKFVFTTFLYVAIFGLLFFSLNLPFISKHWFNVSILNTSVIHESLIFMFIAVVLRWIQSFYRGILTGKQKFVFLSAVNIIGIILKFPVTFYLISKVENPLVDYFILQFVFSVGELIILILGSREVTKKIKFTLKIRKAEFEKMKSTVSTTGKIGLGTLGWLMINQADKFLLSGLMTLSSYGYFSTMSSISGGVAILSTPILSTTLPKFTEFVTKRNLTDLKNIFNNVVQFIVFLMGGAVITLTCVGKEFLILWSKNIEFSEAMALPLTVYVWAMFFGAINALIYNLLLSCGEIDKNLKAMFIQVITFLVLFFPLVQKFGALGSGCALLISNLLNFVIVIGNIKNIFHINISSWIFKNILIPLVIGLFVNELLKIYLLHLNIHHAFLILALTFSSLITLLLCLDAIRTKFKNLFTHTFLKLQKS